MSPAAGTDHEVAAAGPSAAGSRGGRLGLERGLLLWALQGGEALDAGPTGNAAGGREALKAAAAAKSPAERPREFALQFSAALAGTFVLVELFETVGFSVISQHSGLSMGSSSMGSQWVDSVGMWAGPGGLESKGVSGGSSGGMGMWDEAVKNQSGLRATSNNNMGLKNSRSSPSLRYPEPRWQNSHSNTHPSPFCHDIWESTLPCRQTV